MKTVLLYGCPSECRSFGQYLKEYTVQCVSNQDELIHALEKKRPAAIMVIMENAAGMEGVIVVRKLYPDVPVAWFSNDRGFAPQAYRLNVDYFALMPVTGEKVCAALKKCAAVKNV